MLFLVVQQSIMQDRGRPIRQDQQITNSGYLRLNPCARQSLANSNRESTQSHQHRYANPYNDGGYGTKETRQRKGSVGEVSTQAPQKYEIDYSMFGQIPGQKADQFTACYHCTKCCRNPESCCYRCQKVADLCDKTCSPFGWCCVVCTKLCPGS